MNSTSVSLLERIRDENEVAWARFVDIYSPLVFYWCGDRAGLSPEDSADIMQEVFKSVATNIKKFQRAASGQFRGWLRVITTNKIRDFHRRQGRSTRSVGGSTMLRQLADHPDQISDDEGAEKNEKAIITRRALALMQSDFEETSWQAFWQSAVEGKSAQEIAELLGITKEAVWQACYRVRKRLREELSEMMD